MNLLIVIPAYNEEKTIERVVLSVPKKINRVRKYEILVVDDGSSDETGQKARRAGAIVISHYINRGLGGAIGTGFEYAKRNNYDAMITLDADGQHDPHEINTIVEGLVKNRANICIGSRLMNLKGMPWYRAVGNYGLNIITFILFGVWTTDSQSGFRAFSYSAIQKIDIRADRMEVSSEIFSEISKHNLKFCEMPIRAIYTNYSLSKGQKNSNAFKIILKLIIKKLTT